MDRGLGKVETELASPGRGSCHAHGFELEWGQSGAIQGTAMRSERPHQSMYRWLRWSHD